MDVVWFKHDFCTVQVAEKQGMKACFGKSTYIYLHTLLRNRRQVTPVEFDRRLNCNYLLLIQSERSVQPNAFASMGSKEEVLKIK